jgi:hypothetical protein
MPRRSLFVLLSVSTVANRYSVIRTVALLVQRSMISAGICYYLPFRPLLNVTYHCTEMYDFGRLHIVAALRAFLSSFRLPGESQVCQKRLR